MMAVNVLAYRPRSMKFSHSPTWTTQSTNY